MRGVNGVDDGVGRGVDDGVYAIEYESFGVHVWLVVLCYGDVVMW
jgi:hypothetical protein